MEVLGIMSGSSLDGLDLVLCEIRDKQYKLRSSSTISLPETLKLSLKEITSCSVKEYLVCRKDYSDFVANCILDFAKNKNVDLIALHGHTCFHLPEEGISLQLSDGARISALTSFPLVTDFRSGDIALGGVGTPLVPVLEQEYLSGYDYYLNLGGIANITDAQTMQAYDICPCNQLLNYLAEKEDLDYDAEGKIGRSGALNKEMYKRFSAPQYYLASAPKSLDNSWIRDYYFSLFDLSRLSNADMMHTSYQWITDLIIGALSRSDAKALVTGGGAHNSYFMELLNEKSRMRNLNLVLPEDNIIDFKEAILMCVMAYRRVLKLPNILSSVTGASKDNLGGAIYDVHGKG